MFKLRNIYLLLTTLFFIKSCFSESTGRFGINSASVEWKSTLASSKRWTTRGFYHHHDHHYHRRIPFRHNTDSTKFADLNSDVLFQIFNELTLKDLLNLAKINAKLSFLVYDLFRRKYRNYKIQILRTDLLPEDTVDDANGNQRIEIYDLQTTITILKRFGYAIKKLDIRMQNINETISVAVNHLLNTYCSESLSQLNLNYIKESTFELFTTPFKHMKELSFAIDKRTIHYGLPLNYLFPKLERLKLKLYSDADIRFIDYEFPHLKHLSLIASKHAWHRSDQIERFISKNPQISGVELKFVSSDFIKIVNKLLPHLKIFTSECSIRRSFSLCGGNFSEIDTNLT